MLIARWLTICHGYVSVDRWFSGQRRRYISFRESYDSSIVCASLLRYGARDCLIFRGRSYGPVLILLIPRVILHRSFPPFSGETFAHVGFSAIFRDYTSVRDIFYVILQYFLNRKHGIKTFGIKRGLINMHLRADVCRVLLFLPSTYNYVKKNKFKKKECKIQNFQKSTFPFCGLKILNF